MATPDSVLLLAIKVKRRNSTWMKDKLFPAKDPVGSQPGEGRATRRAFKVIGDILAGMVAGVYTGNVWGSVLDAGGVPPTGQITCTVATAAGKTVTFTYGGLTVVLTEGATGMNGFARGATNATLATGLATCINAHPILSGLMTASPVSNVINLMSKIPTQLLNDISMSTNDPTAFVLAQFSGGSEGTAKIFPQQFWVNRNR